MMISDAQWPVALLLLQIANRLFATHLQSIPDKSVRTISRGTHRLLKLIVELATTYILFAQGVSSFKSETPLSETPSEERETKPLAIEGMVSYCQEHERLGCLCGDPHMKEGSGRRGVR